MSRLISESGLQAQMEAEGLRPYRWDNAPRFSYPVHDHPYHKVIYCVEGSIEFQMPTLKKNVLMKPGDRLDLPAHTPHGAVVGDEGVVCLEAHRDEPMDAA